MTEQHDNKQGAGLCQRQGLLPPVTVRSDAWILAFAETLPGLTGSDWHGRAIEIAEVGNGYATGAGGVGVSIGGSPMRLMVAAAYRGCRRDLVGRAFLPAQERSVSVDSRGRGQARRRAELVAELVERLREGA